MHHLSGNDSSTADKAICFASFPRKLHAVSVTEARVGLTVKKSGSQNLLVKAYPGSCRIEIEICKAPTLRLKALNKHTHIMYIEMENVIKLKKKKKKKKEEEVYFDKFSSIIMQKMHTHARARARATHTQPHTHTHIHTHTHTRTHAHAHTHARTHARTHDAHTHTHTQSTD